MLHRTQINILFRKCLARFLTETKLTVITSLYTANFTGRRRGVHVTMGVAEWRETCHPESGEGELGCMPFKLDDLLLPVCVFVCK